MCKQCHASENRKDYKGLTADQLYAKKKEKEQERKRQREEQDVKNKAELKLAQEKQAEKKRLKKAMFGGSQQSAPAMSSVQPPFYAQHVVDARASHTVLNCAVCSHRVEKTDQNSCNSCGAHAHEKCRDAHSAMHAREEQQAAQMQAVALQNQMQAVAQQNQRAAVPQAVVPETVALPMNAADSDGESMDVEIDNRMREEEPSLDLDLGFLNIEQCGDEQHQESIDNEDEPCNIVECGPCCPVCGEGVTPEDSFHCATCKTRVHHASRCSLNHEC